MRADTVKITELFQSSTVLRIPYYQRAYVWTEENWKRFKDDILSLNDTNDNYFLGSIILKSSGRDENNYPIYNVVDGQQRLTTMVIFAKVLYSLADRQNDFRRNFFLEDSNIPILTPGRKDAVSYNELINLDGLFNMTCRGNIKEAYDYFSKELNRDEIRNQARLLLRKMNNQVLFVRITVESDENEQQIFDTINSLGQDLTTGELLKNHFFNQFNSELYDNEWAPVFDCSYWNSDQLKGRRNSKATESFFYQYMLVKLQDPAFRGRISQSDKKRYRKQEGLFGSFKDLMAKQNIDKSSMIHEIVDYAKLYQKTIDPSVLDETLVNVPAVRRLVSIMFAANFWTPVPYILYLLKNVPDTTDRSNLFRYMETYLMRRIICGKKNNNYSDMFSENLIGSAVNTFEGFKQYVCDTEHRAEDLLMPSDEEVAEALSRKSFKKEEAKLILYFIEAKYNPSFRNEDNDNEFSNIEAMVMLPSKPGKNWELTDEMSADEMSSYSLRLANYFIYHEGQISKRMANKPYSEKKLSLQRASVGLEHLNQVHTRSTVWSKEQIDRRTETLTRMVNETWRVL